MSVRRHSEPKLKSKFKHDLANLLVKDKCRECGSYDLVENSAEGSIYCLDCNLEHSSLMIDYQAEWLSFSDKNNHNDNPARAGGAINMVFSAGGLSTELPKADAQLGVLAKGVGVRRKMEKYFKEIEELTEKLNFSSRKIRECACEVFKKMLEFGLEKSKRLQTIAVASVLYAARCDGGNSYRTFKEMVLSTKIPKKEIFVCFKMIKKNLKNVPGLILEPKEHPIVSFSKNYASYLNLPKQWIKIIASVGNKAKPDSDEGVAYINKSWDGRSETSIAATIVYIVTRLPSCPEKFDIEAVSRRTGVKKSTISSCYRDMLPVVHKLLDELPLKIVSSEEILNIFFKC
jgi:transcription initiation factor TFIIIB Brf1 subunit/transcription initiation factor TFIIB